MKKIIYILPFVLLGACHEPTTVKETPSVIADSLFAFDSIPNTDLINAFWYDADDNYACYADSTKKIKLVRMDSAWKQKILVPMMGGIDAHYIISFVDAYFISKQDKIGSLTPIIVKASGDDYDELIMILLDSMARPVSRFSLYGGECGGPDEIGDTLLLNCPFKHATFKGDEINYYVLHVFDRNQKEGYPSIIDSVTFHTKISADGKFETTRKDSTRYERMFSWY